MFSGPHRGADATSRRRRPTLVALALVCTDLDDPEPDAAVMADLTHRMLHWAVPDALPVQIWGLVPSRRRRALAGAVSIRGPKVRPRLPTPVLFVMAWSAHVVLSLRARGVVAVAPFPLLGLAYAALRALRLTRQPFAVRVVGRTATAAQFLRGARGRAAAIDTLEAFVLRRADVVLPISVFTKELALAAGVAEERIILMPDPAGAPMPRRHTGQRPPGPVRLVCGARLIPEKGVDRLVSAVAALIPAHDVHLDVAGDGPERAPLEAWVRQLGVDQHITFHGMVDRFQMDELLDRADIAVLPSIVEEGLSRFLVEAAGRGCALVATALGGTADVVRHGINGQLVAADDVEALATALASLVTDPQLAARMGAAGGAVAEEIYRQKAAGLDRFRDFCRTQLISGS